MKIVFGYYDDEDFGLTPYPDISCPDKEKFDSSEEYRKAAVGAVKQLAHDVDIPENLKGIMDIKDLDFIAESALNDVCTGGNPRDTNLEEIKELYKKLL